MRAIGLMSGTSMDGIDGVLLETDGKYQINCLETASLRYEKSFMQALKQQTPDNINPDIVQASTVLHGEIIKKLINSSVQLIGYHGQTIYHQPLEKMTIQIGNPEFLAAKFKLPVITDFRLQDMQHGGQGAPLAPLYHQALARQKNLDNLVMINCGGISNVTVIREKKILAGFDTGPGNVLLDRFVREWTNSKYLMDKDGKFAAQGIIDTDFLKILLAKTTRNHFYAKLPPKSLDSKEIIFIDDIHARFSREKPENLYHGCATLAAFTAYSIIENIKKLNKNLNHLNIDNFKYWMMTGGGAKNPAILKALKKFLPLSVKIMTAQEMGWSDVYMEAELIAWLAVRSFLKLPLTLPQTTGVEKPMTGGRCVMPV